MPRIKETAVLIKIDKAKCVKCGECVGACPGSVFELIDGKPYPSNMDYCLGCDTCLGVCKKAAIMITYI